jgi:hypothetical protein
MIQLAEQAQFASGSMLTNIGTLRDELQRSRNTYIRNLQTDIYSFMLQGENYLQQAKATRKGGQAAQFNTILTRGLQGAQDSISGVVRGKQWRRFSYRNSTIRRSKYPRPVSETRGERHLKRSRR